MMYGFSCCMGKNLRKEVERQLLLDLNTYTSIVDELKFDWSESVMEGHGKHCSDGYIQNFSNIKLRNERNEVVVDGWMDFILERDYELFIVYWEFLDIYNNNNNNATKLCGCGIPRHVYECLPKELREKYKEGYPIIKSRHY